MQVRDFMHTVSATEGNIYRSTGGSQRSKLKGEFNKKTKSRIWYYRTTRSSFLFWRFFFDFHG